MGVGQVNLAAWCAALAIFSLACASPVAAQSPNPRAVPTYEAAGFYWTNPPGNPASGCAIRFRTVGAATWVTGLAMWFDSRNNECRGSVVGLAPDTDYEAELSVPGNPQARSVLFRTWANQKPIKKTIPVLAGSTTLDITESGSAAEGYVVYQAVPVGAILDVNNLLPNNVVINASYVILRGFVLRGAQQHAIVLATSANVTDVIIEDNEISGWGRQRLDSTWGMDLDSAIRAVCTSRTLDRVTIQRNEIHDPRHGANSWSDGHPAGPQAITFSFCGGNHVIRHNEIFSSTGRYYNDIIGGEDNFSTTGFPNTDSDIYGNELSHAWDDGIESEGGNRNARIWGNYIDRTATGIATTVTSIGPVYVFRNVWNRNRFYETLANPDLDDRQPFFKAGSDATLGYGRRYFFHNTMLQADPPPGSSLPQGGGNGLGGTGASQLVQNTFSKNNIYHLWKNTQSAYFQVAASGNEFERDMFNGPAGAAVTSGINAAPTYQAGNGPASEAGGMYALATGTPGHDQAVPIANFNDSFVGAAPDVGAHEAGAPPMKFGIAASAGSAVAPVPPPALTGVASSKAQGAGTFTLAIDASQPVGGAVTVEPRAIGTGHRLVFTFNAAIWYAGTVSCVDAQGAPIGSASALAGGNAVEVTITGIPDARRATIALANVNNAGTNVSASVGFLAGDVDGSRGVTASDILRTKGRAGAVTAANFVHDVDLNGTIEAADVTAVKQRAGLQI